MTLNWKTIRKPGYIGYVLYDGVKKKGMVDRKSFGSYVGYVLSEDEEIEQGIMKMVVGAGDVKECKHRLEEYVVQGGDRERLNGTKGTTENRNTNKIDEPF